MKGGVQVATLPRVVTKNLERNRRVFEEVIGSSSNVSDTLSKCPFCTKTIKHSHNGSMRNLKAHLKLHLLKSSNINSEKVNELIDRI